MKKGILITLAFMIVAIVLLFAYKGSSNFEDDTTPSDVSANAITSSTDSEKDLSVNDFPVVKKAVLYKNGVAEEIMPDDDRITQMVDYIMCSIEEKNYGWVRGVIENSTLEDFYKPKTGRYLILDLDSENSVEFNRYDSAVVSHSEVIMIDSDSSSYHGEDTPFNYCFTPYYEQYGGYDNIPEILNACGF